MLLGKGKHWFWTTFRTYQDAPYVLASSPAGLLPFANELGTAIMETSNGANILKQSKTKALYFKGDNH